QISKSELNVMKTHRSYVVNLDAVEDVQGNAQGYVLSLTNTDERVPVARNHVNDFNLLMNG
ncbi:MAG: LytTR family transcriptional regulator, partial [Crocinitomicaceae bacterium]|nr:LytTR family transcriptional regulator [Crocinitomicaceae bacterium]